MKKAIQSMGVFTFMIMHLFINAQIKVYTGGNVAVGSTSVTPNKPLDVIGSGGIRISQTTGSSSTNELYFQDNGQIRSYDDNHRIIFDRTNNIMKFREYGDISFYPGSTGTIAVTVTSAGNLNINGASNSLQINAVKMLWNNNIASTIFVGNGAGASTTGINNSFVGNSAGNANTTGTNNTALGFNALILGNTSYNVAIGSYAIVSQTSGSKNSGVGYTSLYSNTSGNNNTALGYGAVFNTSSGSDNTGIGMQALNNNTLGSSNTAVGYWAGATNTTGSTNTFLGKFADVNGTGYSNVTAIGYNTVVTASNKIFVGNTSVTHIQGQVAFTTYSDGRFKTDVLENVKGLEFINKLRPVTYKMNTQALNDFLIQNMSDSIKLAHQTGMNFGPSMAIVHSGFIAQEVELAAQQTGFTSSIVSAPANSQDPYALSYSEIVVPLVKAVQELSKSVDSLQTQTEELSTTEPATASELQALQAQVNQLQSMIESCCSVDRSMQQQGSTNDALSIKNNTMLYQNKPNPFHDRTEIDYYIPTNCTQASIIVFDMQGKLIKEYPLEQKEKGSIKIEGSSLRPGMYMYSLVVDNKEVDTKRMILTE